MSQLLIFLALAVFVAVLMQKKGIELTENLHQSLSVNRLVEIPKTRESKG